MEHGFFCFVVKGTPSVKENYIKLGSVPTELFKQEAWDRNHVAEVHVIGPTFGFVVKNADALRSQMLGRAAYTSADVPPCIARRIENESPA